MKNKLKERLNQLMRRLDYRNDQITDHCFSEIERMYSDPPRTYHNLDHISQCLDELEQVGFLAKDLNAVEFAIWFHDCIYDSTKKDNEEMSAAIAFNAAVLLGQSMEFVDKVVDLIRATKHIAPPDDQDEKLIVDIDLASFGQEPEVFDKAGEWIRVEYSWVPEDQYRAARAAILQSFLDRSTIYSTTTFFRKYEEQAKRNLERAIEKLKHPE